MHPGHPGTKQCALRLCESIHRCSWKHLQLWRYIQDATRFDLQNIQILKLLRPVRRSAGDFRSSWNCYAALRETSRALRETWCHILTSVVLTYPQGISSHHIHLCYSHKIHYIKIWHALFKTLYIYSYGQFGRRWWSRIIRGVPRHAHWENLEMHHFGGRCGETMELEGREPTINTQPHLSRHSNRIHEKERF